MDASACCGLSSGEACRCHSDAAQLAEVVRAFVRARVRDRNDADDVAQEALRRLYRSVHTLRDAGALEGWAVQIARSAIADHYRRLGRVPTPTDVRDLEDAAAPQHDEHREALGACVTELMDRLPEAYQRALRLTDIEGMTQQQAGVVLGIGTSGAKSRVQRGRRMLRAEIAHCCDVALDSQGALADLTPRRPTPRC